ncbi:MAG: hypothetical protein SOT28_10760 [Fusicatenibacter sp.]|nr:hypothetical protein [Lachnospiraceae bacterium]MDY2938770.1 hypothetical protein [Fusicatenibacter sp.]
MRELLSKPLPVIPADIQEKLDHPSITMTPFENTAAMSVPLAD